MKTSILTVLFLCILQTVIAQTTQIVKGQLIDKQSQYPLIGATVIIPGTDPLIGGVTDTQGYFKLTKVPLGRVSLRFSLVGYKEQTMSNILVTAGKEVVVNIQLEESVELMNEIVITAVEDKTEPLNDLATVSVRGFNLEETSRYAGSRNDPARMATNFAGVSGANDGRNDIIIRGNSPAGLLWRLEGLDIPNPNHFGSIGTTGGPVSMLNNNLLDNSEFMTGAFPAEYGNALSGVFDLRMRNGNNEKREYIGQVGFNGFEFGAEGPLSKNSNASYLINYRYSFLDFFDKLGINLGTGSATPRYQDLSFKLNFPTAKGKVSVFGLGGMSSIDLLGSDKTAADTTDLFGEEELDIINSNKTGIIGVSNTIFPNSKTYHKTILAVSGTNGNNSLDTLFRDDDFNVINAIDFSEQDFTQVRYTFKHEYNRKFNAKNQLTAGVIYDLYSIDFQEERLVASESENSSSNFKGNTSLLQGYVTWQHRFSDKLTLNTGLHYQELMLNNSRTFEPRVGLKYQLNDRQSINFGYGRHNQIQPLPIYFLETVSQSDGTSLLTNKGLDFTTSDHFILGYDHNLGTNLRLKVEGYYQNITNAPVDPNAGYFSVLNSGADFLFPRNDSLVNEGSGYNTGIEITLERFFSKSYYFLITTSLFNSKYKGSDGIERNTEFNGNYVVNTLFGKEFKVGKKKNTLGFDFKLTVAGNRRFIPYDIEKSRELGFGVFDYDKAYEERFDKYFRTDFKVTFRKDGKKVSQEWVLDIQNITNRENIYFQRFNKRQGRAQLTNQLGLFPIVQYRILF